jgi:hypothetical protein
MFEESKEKTVAQKKRKALIYAGVTTFIIAILYLLLSRGRLYNINFSSLKKDLSPAVSSISESKEELSKGIKTGKEIINKTKN